MICKGCGEDRKLIKAHVIPESIFRFSKGKSDTLKVFNTDGNAPAKKAPIGVYDKELLCQECENRFKITDDYASTILLQEKPEVLTHDGEVIGYRLLDVDIEKLKLFFIGLLWRASLSSHEFYKKVNLGKFEEKAKDIVWGKECEQDDFTFVLSKFEGEASRAILDPERTRLEGINYYVFYLGKYVAHVKVDTRPTSKSWHQPSSKEILVLSRGDIMESKEVEIMVRGVKNTKAYMEKLKSGR